MPSATCPRMAASMCRIPPTAAKACNPAQRLPTRPDMASIPESCTSGASGWHSINPAAARMAPASTSAWGSSGRSPPGESSFASANQPAAPVLPLLDEAAAAASTKRNATAGGSRTSLATSCDTSRGTMACQEADPAAAVAKMPPNAPGAAGFAVAVVATSAATMRATASLALAPASPASGPLAMEAKRVPATSGAVSLPKAITWS
mmetsp:Transcript_46282/g.98927  ORF Transcript_46282/g.98927 Transcript_46282/m.98927 type:complete len:206 (-) Transcript_46282:53-670(-)